MRERETDEEREKIQIICICSLQTRRACNIFCLQFGDIKEGNFDLKTEFELNE